MGLPYRVVPVNIYADAQFTPRFLAISPNNKIPAIVDPAGPSGSPISLFESGAILLYLARKTGQLLPPGPSACYTVLQWLMFQVGGIGPMLGQAHHFRRFAPTEIPYAIDRYTKEAARIYGVLDRRLAISPYLGGESYSIADIATFPWIRSHERQGQDLNSFSHVQRWFAELGKRPAVVRGLELLKEHQKT